MNKNDEFYREFNSKEKTRVSFGTNILLPFISGMLSTLLILGIVFGVPSVKEKILGIDFEKISEKDFVPTSSVGNSENLKQVSLTDFSNTAVGAAEKVLPSIVGISVEYNITSSSVLSFRETSKGSAQGSRNNYKRRWIYSYKQSYYRF